MNEAQRLKKGKLKMIRTEMGLFDFAVITIFGDYKETCKFVAWKFDDEKTDFTKFDHDYIPRGKCFFRKGYIPCIWVPKKPRTAKEHATFAHECLHATFKLFEWAGININDETEEVTTHAMAHIIYNSLK